MKNSPKMIRDERDAERKAGRQTLLFATQRYCTQCGRNSQNPICHACADPATVSNVTPPTYAHKIIANSPSITSTS